MYISCLKAGEWLAELTAFKKWTGGDKYIKYINPH